MNAWLRLMLEEIQRKRQENDEAAAEHHSRLERARKSESVAPAPTAAGTTGRRRGT